MAKFVIQGGRKLSGEVKISGNKNSILPIMAATVLGNGESVLTNVPNIEDVKVMSDILINLGAKISGLGTGTLVINTSKINKYCLDDKLVKKLRASILLLGPLLARFKKAQMRHPGGCLIGRRAVGTHFDALNALGAETKTDDENYISKMVNTRASRIFLDEASVTATENAMMLASLIPGETIIEDAACEPHIEDLANYIIAMGGRVVGAGTNRIYVNGVKELHATEMAIGPDYIDAGTFAILAGVTEGRIKISGIRPDDMRIITIYLQRMNLNIELQRDSLTVLPSKLSSPKGKIQTRPWPGFPTDLMSPLIVMATQSEGTTLCHDWMYETRMFFVDKLVAMGANITICDPHRVLVTGKTRLRGKSLESPDIRAGMAMVVASLCAEGTSEIANIDVIERGHESIDKRLKMLGASIVKI